MGSRCIIPRAPNGADFLLSLPRWAGCNLYTTASTFLNGLDAIYVFVYALLPFSRSPYAYAVKSLAQNEFFAERYNVIPRGSTQTLGEQYLTFFAMPTDRSYV